VIDKILFPLTLLNALGCGLVGGVFFAFSTFVMKALSRLPPHEGIAAMQSINLVVLNPLFLTVFLGTSLGCLLSVLISLLRWQEPGAAYRLIGSGLFLIGSFLITAIVNVPMNERLALIDPAGTDAAMRWTSYVTSWTTWNHLRTAAALAAATLLIFAIHLRVAR
jgi:uncharacterized membrane protein